MHRVRSLVVLFSFAVFLTAGTPASADPIQIQSGHVTVSGAQDFMSRGFLRSVYFDITTELFRLSGFDSDGITQRVLFPVLPRVGTWNPGSAPFGPYVFLEYSVLSVTATPGTAPSPFSLSGRLHVLDMETGATLFDDIVFGAGTATWMWVPSPFGGNDILSGARYEFSNAVVTPEPATMLLLGTGLAALAARRRRQADRRS